MRADPRSAFEFLLGTQGPDLLIPCLPLALSVSAVLNKSTATASALSDRLAQANAAVPAVHNFSKVKKVGIIGAGVAGLQAGIITNPNPIPDPDPNLDPDPEGGQRAAQGRSRGQGLRKERRSGRRLAG